MSECVYSKVHGSPKDQGRRGGDRRTPHVYLQQQSRQALLMRAVVPPLVPHAAVGKSLYRAPCRRRRVVVVAAVCHIQEDVVIVTTATLRTPPP